MTSFGRTESARLWPASLLALAVVLLHVAFNNSYGYFRDELDYIACGQRLAWGFVDHPPLVPALIKLTRVLLGDSLRSLRLIPSLAGGAAVLLTGMLARELGGRTFAVALAALAAAVSPQFLSNGSIFTTNSLEPIFWGACMWCVVRAIKLEKPSYWLSFGVALGLGLEDKYSIGVFAVAITLGVFLTAQRKQFASPWPWLGATVAVLLFLPNFLWNQAHGWPFLELMRNIRASGRDVVLSPSQYVFQQILLMHPLTFPIWVVGLVALFFWPRLRPYRALGWAYLLTFAFFFLSHGKNYYLSPAYPILLAAGAVAVGEWVRSTWARGAIVALLALGGAWLAPVVIPMLPPERLVAYLDSLPFDVPRTEVSHTARLPQHYADQFGWAELADLAGKAWQGLPEADRADCPFFGQNYGQAGAVDYFGNKYGMPPALSGHQTFYLWGAQEHSGRCMIVSGDVREVLAQSFEQVDFVGVTDAPYALEGHIPVFLCRRLKTGTLADLWPRLKKWR